MAGDFSYSVENDYQTIMERMLSRIPDDVDTREGSVAWDILGPAGLEFADMYRDLDFVRDDAFILSAGYESTVLKCAERGIYPKPATPAILRVVVSPSTRLPGFGSVVAVNDLTYTLTDYYQEAGVRLPGYYLAVCNTPGTVGNVTSGDCYCVSVTNDGQWPDSVTISALDEAGEDIESLESLKERYMRSFGNQAFAGNPQAYREILDGLDYVGGTMVYRNETPGSGTVKLVITNRYWGVPTSTEITAAQAAIDAVKPVGHNPEVSGARQERVTVECYAIADTGYTLDDLQDDAAAAVEAYIKEAIATQWEGIIPTLDDEDTRGVVLYYSQIERAILNNVPGILAVEVHEMNSHDLTTGTAMWYAKQDKIPVLKEVKLRAFPS